MRLGLCLCLFLILRSSGRTQDDLTTFSSGGETFEITVYEVANDGERHPLVVVLHGNAGLTGEFGEEVHKVAKAIASKGYNVAVPNYYTDNLPHLTDSTPKPEILADAIGACETLASVDADRIALVGYSLGAATSMSYIASQPAGTVKAFVDFFGPVPATAISAAQNFPPTIIFHNTNDRVVPIDMHSRRLITALGGIHEIHEYDESYREVNHSFRPGDAADSDSQQKTMDWLVKHLPTPCVRRQLVLRFSDN